MAKIKLTSAIADSFRKLFGRGHLQEITVTPAEPLLLGTPTGEIRRAIDESVGGEVTPLTVLNRLNAAKGGSISGFVALVENLLQRDLNYAGARELVSESISGAVLKATETGTEPADKRVAEAVQKLLAGNAVQSSIEHLCGFEDFGFALAELQWATAEAGSEVTWDIVAVAPIPPGWITFDKRDGRTPLLLPAVANGPLRPLEAHKFVWVTRDGYGLPVLRSTGYAAVFYNALKSLTLKDWAGYLEMFGQPLRVGSFDPEKLPSPEDRKVVQKALRNALENLGADAWAVLPEGGKVEFIESATGQGGEGFENFIRYVDEQVSKRITGSVLATGTGNTGAGGSQALGVVHDEKFHRKVASSASFVSHAIREQIVKPFVLFNFGPDVEVPKVEFVFEKARDIVALATVLEKLVPLGLQASREEVLDLLGLRALREGESALATADV